LEVADSFSSAYYELQMHGTLLKYMWHCWNDDQHYWSWGTSTVLVFHDFKKLRSILIPKTWAI